MVESEMNQKTKNFGVSGAGFAGTLSKIFRRGDMGVVVATALLFGLFAIGTESFFTQYNLYNISRTAGLYIFIALGQMIVLVIGHMNLSLGGIGALAVVAAGYTMDTLGWSPWVAVPIALGVGLAAGAFNGLVIIKLKINSFIITLASLFIFTGLVTGISKGFPYTEIPKSYTIIGRGSVLGVPYIFVIAIVTLLIMAYVFKFTVIGRRILATGGNLEAAQLSGIRTDRIILLGHVLSGLFAAIAGLLWVSRMGSAQPATGSDWLIISFAVAIIGGTALTGGEASMLALLASAILLTLIKNGLIMLNVNVYFEQTFLGLIILLAVSIDRIKSMIQSSTKRLRRGSPAQD